MFAGIGNLGYIYRMKSLRLAFCLVLLVNVAASRADQIEMQNGDHYSGKVISMTPDTVVLQSEVLGKITLPRAKVGNIHMGTVAPAVAATAAPAAPTPEMSEALRHLGANTNFVEQVRKQFLDGAGTEANAKYADLINGLTSGKMDINSLRAQAKSAADQIRALKAQGNDMGGVLDSYLSILETFLKESSVTTAVPVTHTNYGVTIIR